MRIKNSNQVIVIEGNIGVGKSTLAESLAQEIKGRYFPEPLNGNPYLKEFYKDPKRWALEMQFFLLAQRVQILKEALEISQNTKLPVVLDRSLCGDAVFAKQNCLDGNFDKRAYNVYLKHWHLHIENFKNAPLHIVYLRADPKTCYDRILHLRARDFESNIPLPYLAGLHRCYEETMADLLKNGQKVSTFDWEKFGDIALITKKLAEDSIPKN